MADIQLECSGGGVDDDGEHEMELNERRRKDVRVDFSGGVYDAWGMKIHIYTYRK